MRSKKCEPPAVAINGRSGPTRARTALNRSLVSSSNPAIDAVVASEIDNLGVDAWPPALVAPGVRGEVPHAHYLVAELSGAVVGHAVVSVVVDVAELQRIAVSTSARRSGVASALLEECVALARSDRADRMLLEVREDNAAALAFYAARGFTEVDRRQRYYRDGTTAVVMRLGLGPRCNL